MLELLSWNENEIIHFMTNTINKTLDMIRSDELSIFWTTNKNPNEWQNLTKPKMNETNWLQLIFKEQIYLFLGLCWFLTL